MLMIFSTMLLLMMLSTMVMLLTSMLSKKTFSDREKNSPFECGFDPTSSARIPFSLQFFLIAIIFLIFDIEITLILPIVLILKKSHSTQILLMTISFIIILLGGLYLEWNQGALEWSK
uniref:NADH-ubiquinone oxidoreductase chain 3 n=1 Tax=Trachys auricollis TaxID=2705174 RepID=A0A6C0AAZ1_9COLE|nr:NADH dehydrogenase subunit 3 [Trachys auricollis]QHS71065.1 NADH dehydrogenase subunit 3 [Trachys auricollis]